MSEYKEYLQGLLKELAHAEARNRQGIYRINDKISNETADYVKKYFMDKPQYSLELRRCKSCMRSSYDVMITIRKI
jgi:hypothetical protein